MEEQEESIKPDLTDLYKASAEKIWLKLEKLKNPTERDLYVKSWVYELIQNACDNAKTYFPAQSIKVLFQWDKIKNLFLFKHNFGYFTITNIRGIIGQKNSDDKKPQENGVKETIGRYGSGFITSHLLSKKITVETFLQKTLSTGVVYKSIQFPLDRSANSENTLWPAIKESFEISEKSDKNSKRFMESEIDFSAFTTSFQYELENNKCEVGLKEMQNTILFAMAFTENLNTVLIQDEETTTEFEKQIFSNTNFDKNAAILLSKQLIFKKENGKIVKQYSILVFNDITKQTSISIQFENEQIVPLINDFPKLFIDFPIIGAEKFHLPIIANSQLFRSNEARSAIDFYITEENEGSNSATNKNIFQNSILPLTLALLEYATANNWGNLWELAKIKMPEADKNFDNDWFKDNFQTPLYQKLLTLPIVDTENGRRAIQAEENGAYIDFPYYKDEKIGAAMREKIWDLCAQTNHFILPRKADIHQWYEVISENPWESKYCLDLETIARWVSGLETLDTLATRLGKDKAGAITWLNEFFGLLHNSEKNLKKAKNGEKEQDIYKIIPNQNGDFCTFNELCWAREIDEQLKDALQKLSYENREVWADDDLLHWDFPTEKTATQITVIVAINEGLADKNKAVTVEIKNEVADDLLACLAAVEDTESEKRELLYNLCADLWAMPEKSNLQYAADELWDTVIKNQLNLLVAILHGFKNVATLSEKLAKTETESLLWLNNFVHFLINHEAKDRLELKTTFFLPNQNGVFCQLETLWLDQITHDELKDAYDNIWGIEVKTMLLNLEITALTADFFPKRCFDTAAFSGSIITAINKHNPQSPNANFNKGIFAFVGFAANENDSTRVQLFEKMRVLYPDEVANSMFYAAELTDFDFLPVNDKIIRLAFDKVEKLGNLDTLKTKLKNADNQAAAKWLNEFFTFIWTMQPEEWQKNNWKNLLEQAVIPNQLGDFCSQKLHKDDLIPEPLKDILESLGGECRAILADNNIKFLSFTKKSTEDISLEINKKLDLNAAYQLACLLAPNEPKRSVIYDFAKKLCPDLGEKQKFEQLKYFDFTKSDELVIKNLLAKIQETKNLETFKSKYFGNETGEMACPTWLSAFINFVEDYDSRLLDEFYVIPNQEKTGIFCAKQRLNAFNCEKEEYDKALERLKDIAEFLNINFRENLLHLSIDFLLPKEKQKKELDLAYLIIEACAERFAEPSRSPETQTIFNALYIWFQEHKRAEKLFGVFYENRHKLCDESETAKNISIVENLKAAGVDLEKLAQNPELIAKTLEQAEKVSQNDLNGLADNRDSYILAEAKKLLQQQNTTPEADSDDTTTEAKKLDNLRKNIPQATSKRTGDLNIGSGETKTGNWGEEFVFKKLQEKEAQGKISNLNWLNQNGVDAKKGYDFTYTEKNKTIYADAKATAGRFETSVEITSQEIERILEHEQNYLIYRVYQADLSDNTHTKAKCAVKKPFKQILAIAVNELLEKYKSSNGLGTVLQQPEADSEETA